MDLQDALRALGVDASASHEEARRAYLRKLKSHKPERDPEGFQRVRAAWERVDAALRGHRPTRDEPRPEAARADEVEPALAEEPTTSTPEPPPWVAVYERAYAAREIEDADAVREAFALAADDASLPPPPLERAVDLALAALAAQEDAVRGALVRSIERWIDARGGSARVLRDRLLHRWITLQTLVTVRDRLPRAALEAIVAGVRTGDVEAACERLRMLHAENPAAARDAAGRLALEPVLARYATALGRGWAPRDPGPSRSWRPVLRWGWIAGMAMMWFSRAAFRCDGLPETRAPVAQHVANVARPNPPSEAPRGPDTSPFLRALPEPTSTTRAAFGVGALYVEARTLGSKPLMDAAGDLQRALNANDCVWMSRAMTTYDAEAKRAGALASPDAKAARRLADAAYAEHCGLGGAK